MNPEIIHDALTLLPPDLIQETDSLRSRPSHRRSHLPQLAALAACMALILGSGYMLLQYGSMGASKTAAPEEPMMQAAPAAPAADNAPMAPLEEESYAEVPAAEAALEEYQDTNTTVSGHTHAFAEPGKTSGTGSHAYCGNTTVTIHTSEGTFSVSGSDGIAISDILIHLNYEHAKICDCEVSLTVDTETLTGIGINLEKGFARCDEGQADLTEKQARTIREITDGLN